ncbi:methyltransferase domain-containing protein [Saxibacter everestensis]|uniref:Methyltransferase domain-containing protein n=1 Tax=Saxibacter everestensis TaxID=2909229 RepID=A0ABY8QS43_9MICO|nr:methyltransferase domain-containing protein [Brevibacteriaceae bacterium ZFBP1038]
MMGRPDLRHRAVDEIEQMDEPGCDPRKLNRTYAQFPLVNAVVAGWRGVYRNRIRDRLAGDREHTLLDIGSGGGDLARAFARWAARDGIDLHVTAIDPDQRAYNFAVQRPAERVSYRQAASSDLVREGQRFDVVISNHVLHHLCTEETAAMLADCERLANSYAVHSDIARSLLAYRLFSIGSLPFSPGSFIRPDGLTSIRRSYTLPELRDIAPPGWSAESDTRLRNLLVREFDAGHA